MEDKEHWARLRRLLDPEDMLREAEISGQTPERSGKKPLTEEEYRKRIDESDQERDTEW